MNINQQIFHSYDVRGVYPDELNQETAYHIGWGFGQYLKKDLKLNLPFEIVVGMDMRGSSPFLAREVVRGLNEHGIDVVEIGRVSTPAFNFAIAFRDFSGGIMVTASHNPKQYNGFKFCSAKAVAIGLGSGLEKIRDYANLEPGKPEKRGSFRSLPNMTQDYVKQDLSYLNPGKIQKFRIAADPANAMGALYLEELFKVIPVDVIKLNWDLNGNMPIHEANPLKEETLQQLKEVMKHEHADFGIATDGDGDRIAFLDEQAQIIPPAIIVGLIAQELLKKHPGSRIGYDLRMSRVAKEMIESAGGIAVETRVGHSYIKALMSEQDILFSGELSSHYYFRENYNFESPVFVTAMLLLIRSEAGKLFSEIWKAHQKYAHSGEVNFEVADKQKVLDRLEQQYHDGQVSKLDGVKIVYPDWWFSARLSNTEPFLRLNLEAADESAMKAKVEEISKLIKS